MAKRKKSEYSPDEILDVDVDKIIEKLSNQFGKGIAFQGGSEQIYQPKDIISTGIFSLDRALGIGGFPVGRIIEAFGPQAGGKTSLALKVSTEAQKKGIPVFYIDLEHSLDIELANNSGLNIEDKNFCISQPSYGEEAFSVIETILRSGLSSFIVVDSVAALLPKAELESGFLESTQLGRQAALMSEGLRKLAGVVSKSNSTVVFVNQTRQQIGSFFAGAVNTPGGNALKFYSSIRLKVSRVSEISQKEETIGHVTKIKVEKNKLAAPFKEVVVDLYYGSGFCSISDILGIAIARKIVNQSGAWFDYNGERIGQGKLNVLRFLIKNIDVYKEIRDKVLQLYEKEISYPEMYIDKTIKIGDSETVFSEITEVEADNPTELELADDTTEND